MIFGIRDIFSRFLSSQMTSRVGGPAFCRSLVRFRRGPTLLYQLFQDVAGFLNIAAQKLTPHAHMIAVRYLALML